MTRTIHKTEQPVVLEGYQAVLKPSKFGYSLSALVDSDLVDKLEEDRTESLKWAETCLLYTSPSPRDVEESRMPSSA